MATATLPILTRGDMHGLVNAFPSLRRKGLTWAPDADATAFLRQVKDIDMSPGEYLCAAFCLHIWNTEHTFDWTRAFHVMDPGNLAVVQAWCLDPWFA